VSTNAAAVGESITERLVAALSGAWRAIQAQHPDVPDVVLTIGSGTNGRRSTTKLGHFGSRRWVQVDGQEVHELFIGGEGLARGAVDVLGTLLHEATHAVAEQRKIVDTSRAGVYHNGRFRLLAEELGLAVGEDPRRGWTLTTVPPATAELYEPQVRALEAALTAHRAPEQPQPAGGGSAGRRVPARCACPKPRRFWISESVLALGGILCQVCGTEFATDE
jgi:hypothetical protein